MRTEKDNQTWYRQTFDEVHASGHLRRKVEAMKHERETFNKILPKGMIAAAAFGILVFSNVISYAASGSPWILTITLPGGETRQVEMDPSGEGVQITDYDFEAEDCAAEQTGSTEVITETSAEDTGYRLQREGEHLYLILDKDCRVDIAEEFQEGSCKGTLDTDEGIWYYEVTGTQEDYDVQVYFVTYNRN